ncbi:hypothetical protein [Nonomuraea endophytica]|uniref:hypothetical protein n=1 Tax=Nonomuraea endophytica TaxID=714136 RepID=UPI0037C8F966
MINSNSCFSAIADIAAATFSPGAARETRFEQAQEGVGNVAKGQQENGTFTRT